MKPLEKQWKVVQGQIAVKQVIKQILSNVNRVIENKILMSVVPQYSIEQINALSSNVLDIQKTRHETYSYDFDSPCQQPRSIKFDKQMSRSCHTNQFKTPRRCNYQQYSKSPSKSKYQTEDDTKSQLNKSTLKQKISFHSFQLGLSQFSYFNNTEFKLRRRKMQQQKRKQYEQNVESIVNDSIKPVITQKQIGVLLSMRKDFTYDYNGAIIPVSKFQRITQPRVDIKYLQNDKKQKSNQISGFSKIKSKMKKTQIKLSEAESCFHDIRSPFYKNFDFTSNKRMPESKYDELEQKFSNMQTPNYMRILTQEGGIKKRYARYKTESGQNRFSIMRERVRQSSVRAQQVARLSKFSVSQKQLSTIVQQVAQQKAQEKGMQKIDQKVNLNRFSLKNRIRVFNQSLKQNIIESSHYENFDQNYISKQKSKFQKQLPLLNLKLNNSSVKFKL